MKLSDFMDTALSKAASGKLSSLGITETIKAANHLYRSNFTSPAHTQVRFDFSIVRLGRTRTDHFNLLVRINPDHPYFRPWLKPRALRWTEPLYSVNFEHLPPKLSLCQQPADAEITDIVDTLERRIIQTVERAEQCIRILNTMTSRYRLPDQELCALVSAVDDLSSLSPYDRQFFLYNEHRAQVLPTEFLFSLRPPAQLP